MKILKEWIRESVKSSLRERLVTVIDSETGEEFTSDIKDVALSSWRNKEIKKRDDLKSEFLSMLNDGRISAELPEDKIAETITLIEKKHASADWNRFMRSIVSFVNNGGDLELFTPSNVDLYKIPTVPPAPIAERIRAGVSKTESAAKIGNGELASKLMFGHVSHEAEPDVIVPTWGGLALKSFLSFTPSQTTRLSFSSGGWRMGHEGEYWMTLAETVMKSFEKGASEFQLGKQGIALKLSLSEGKFSSAEEAAASMAEWMCDAAKNALGYKADVRAMLAVSEKTGEMALVSPDELRPMGITMGTTVRLGAPVEGISNPKSWLIKRLLETIPAELPENLKAL